MLCNCVLHIVDLHREPFVDSLIPELHDIVAQQIKTFVCFSFGNRFVCYSSLLRTRILKYEFRYFHFRFRPKTAYPTVHKVVDNEHPIFGQRSKTDAVGARQPTPRRRRPVVVTHFPYVLRGRTRFCMRFVTFAWPYKSCSVQQLGWLLCEVWRCHRQKKSMQSIH